MKSFLLLSLHSAGRWLLLGPVSLAVLAACGSSGPVAPAPIESRTQAPASTSTSTRPLGQAMDKAAASVRPGSGARAASTAPAATASVAPGAESSAVRSGGVEVRALDARNAVPAAASAAPAVADPPLTLQRSTESRNGATSATVPAATTGATTGTSAGAGAGAGTAQPSTGPGALRSTPRGNKRLYSAEVLAEMRAADPGPPPAAAAPVAEPAASGASSPSAGAAAISSTTGAGTAGATPAAAAPGVAAEPGPIELAWPLRGRLLEGFAEPRSMGLSIAAEAGEPVLAAADGKVIFSGNGPRGYGNLIIVRHDADTLTVYAHNRALLAREGQTVRRGQKIAEVGDSGADRPQLHFEVRRNGRPVDPLKLLPPQ